MKVERYTFDLKTMSILQAMKRSSFALDERDAIACMLLDLPEDHTAQIDVGFQGERFVSINIEGNSIVLVRDSLRGGSENSWSILIPEFESGESTLASSPYIEMAFEMALYVWHAMAVGYAIGVVDNERETRQRNRDVILNLAAHCNRNVPIAERN